MACSAKARSGRSLRPTESPDRPSTPAIYGPAGAGHNTFNLPTDVAFAPNGDFYVSDGYAGNRVVKFSHDGKYLLEWGTRGTGPGQFELPHNLAVDAEGKVYVTDRETHRIEVFDSSGHFLNQWPTIEAVSGLYMTKDEHLWADSGDVYLSQLNGKVRKFAKQ
jgi:DNA-binding beta-propeller fold protein YncE